MDTKKIFVLLMMGIFMISMASAFEFDNSIKYSEDDLKVTLINNNFLKIGEFIGYSSDMGSFKLKSHPTVDYVKKVKTGLSVVMWYDVDNFKEIYYNGLGDVEFKDMRTGEIVERRWRFVYWGSETYYKPVYSLTTYENLTQAYVKTGLERATREAWIYYNSRDIPMENLTIGVEVDVQNYDFVDVVWKIGGQKVSLHASYGAEVTDAHGNVQDNSGALSVGTGGAIVPKFNVLLTRVTTEPTSNPTSASVYYGGNLSLLVENSSVVNDEWLFDVTLNANELYIIEVDSAGASYTQTWKTSGAQTFPIVGTNIDYVWGTTTDGTLNSTQVQTLKSITTREEIADSPPNITLNSPSTANYTTPQSLEINFTVWDDINLTNVDLYVNDILNQSNTSGINNTDYIFNLNLGDGDYIIYGRATDNNSAETNSSSIRIVIDTALPTITSAYNLTDLVTLSLPINSTWHYNATDEHLDSCYYNSTANATQTIITCNSTINTTWTTQGNKTITFCANDTFGLESCNTENAYIYYIQETQSDNPDPVTESFDATFNFTINLTSIPTTTATLVLNNTEYAPTTTTAGVNEYYFEVTVTIPEGWGNTTGVEQDWFWNYTIDGVVTDELTDTENITVYALAIDDCSSFGEIVFNFSVLDEGTLIEANESLSIDVEADLTLTSKADATQYISYSNTWSADNNPQLCVPSGVINNSQFWMDLTVGYSSTDHVWEFFYIDSGTLNSTKIYESFNGLTEQDVNLMDLLTADSTSFLFNYFNIDGLAVDGAIVHVMRKYIGSGEFLEVERAKQDQNGDTIVHLVEEDVIYYFLITKDGELLFTSSTYTALCQATPCTIQIEASGGSASFPTDWDLVDGGAYDLSSSSSSREVTLNFTFNESDTMNLTVYKYNSDGSYSVVDTNSSTGLTGSMVVSVPLVAGNVSFFASVTKGNDFVNSEWVDLDQSSRDSIGITLGLFLSALIILSLGLMTISEGAGTILYIMLGVFVSGALGLMATELSTGVSVTVYLIVAGGMLLWKFTRRRS